MAVHEGLRYRLDGEGFVGIADRVDRAVNGRDRDAETGRIGLAEFGNVIGGTAAGETGDASVEFRQVVRDWRRGACARLQTWNLVHPRPSVAIAWARWQSSLPREPCICITQEHVPGALNICANY